MEMRQRKMKSGRGNMKKIVALLLALMMTISITGCSSSAPEKADSTNAVSASDSAAASDDTAQVNVEEEQSQDADSTTGEDSFSANEEIASEAESMDGADDTDPRTTPVADASREAESAPEETSPITIPSSPKDDLEAEVVEEENDDGLSATQRNSINMLNYMTALTQNVNEQKKNQLFLETAYNSFDNLYPNSVDTKTQAQITSLMDTIQNYRMISVKRDRLEFIYEQNRAQAMRQAIPNPVALLSAVQSGSLLKAAASVLYMAVDSATSYKAATSQADLQFIKDGWELDDAESAELHNSTKNALTYLLNMVRDYDIPGDYALNREAVEDFVLWSSKPDSQLVAKISWFESHESTYSEFGPYWLEVAKDYYNAEEYEKCLEAFERYETIITRIFRKNIDYATALPMAIISAKETMNEDEYVATADRYCSTILSNTKDADWSLRYFVAQIYMDLYSITEKTSYLDAAYKIAFDNVVVLVDEQRSLNDAYLADVVEAKAEKGATKREKQEVSSYNKALKEERKIALPPVSEALYLNCDLLFALADERNISTADQRKIEAVLHENGEPIFLTQALDSRFWFDNKPSEINADDISISFDGEKLTIPASCITDRSTIIVTVSGENGKTLADWNVDNVKRPKKSEDCSEFIVTFTSKDGKDYKYQSGDVVTITVVPVAESPEEHIDFTYNVVAVKKALVFNGVKFERVTK